MAIMASKCDDLDKCMISSAIIIIIIPFSFSSVVPGFVDVVNGSCPLPTKGRDGICDRMGDQCTIDSTCSGDNEKCCFNGCQRECIDVIVPPPGTILKFGSIILIFIIIFPNIFHIVLLSISFWYLFKKQRWR